MIQIDDAGSGSLIGGTMIGALRVESMDCYYDLIPLKYFKSPYFENKDYIKYSTKIVCDALAYLKPDKDEPIEICRGYIFDHARPCLTSMGYNVIPSVIKNPLQDIIEREYFNYIISVGVPEDYLKYTRYPFHFHRLLKWVLADYKNRSRLCKTGWQSWKKYSSTRTISYTDYIYSGNYCCLKCGASIDVPGRIKVIEFETNRRYFIYMHENCPAKMQEHKKIQSQCL